MMKRARADAIVAAMIAEAEAINRDPRFMHRVVRLSVFGSYLTDKPVLGDLDVGFELKACWRRDDDASYDIAHKRFLIDFPPPAYIGRNFFGRMFWPESVVLRRLRVGRGISFHEHSELDLLECPRREVFAERLDHSPA